MRVFQCINKGAAYITQKLSINKQECAINLELKPLLKQNCVTNMLLLFHTGSVSIAEGITPVPVQQPPAHPSEDPQQRLSPHPAAPRPPVITASTPKRDARKGFQVNSNNSFVQQTPGESASDRLSEEVAALTVEAGGDKAKNPALSAASKGAESPSSSRPQTPQRFEHPPMGVPRSSSK